MLFRRCASIRPPAQHSRSWSNSGRYIVGNRRLFTTYYDSQSGMHVSCHNQDEISVHVHARDTAELLHAAQKAGIHGAIMIGSNSVPTTWDAGPEFTIFTQSPLPFPSGQWHPLLDYNDEPEKARRLADQIAAHVSNGTKTAISLLDNSNYVKDPIEVANGVASLIDQTGGGNSILVGYACDVDDVLALCEELVYLDVTGPTMKSRIIVDLTTAADTKQELMEETMSMGINKFVIQGTWLDWFQNYVVELGKGNMP